MKYIYITFILFLQYNVVNAQELTDSESEHYNTLMENIISHSPFNHMDKIYILSDVYPPAKDSLKNIIQFLDQKVSSGNIFGETDKYTSKYYGSNSEDIINNQIVSKYRKNNIWSYITSCLNIASEDLYPNKKISQILEENYCKLNHSEHIAYTKKHGNLHNSFVYLLYQGKYDLFKSVIEDDFEGMLDDGCLNCFISSTKYHIENTLVNYYRISENEAKKHPKMKAYYLAILKYLEWDNNNLQSIKKVINIVDQNFASDSDFSKYRTLAKGYITNYFNEEKGGWENNGNVTTTIVNGRLEVNNVSNSWEGIKKET